MDENGAPREPRESELDIEPWEQQPNEPPLYFRVFDLFCQLGPERSVRAAALKFYAESGQTPPRPAAGRFTYPAIRWRWQERADLYWRGERRRQEAVLREKRDRAYQRHAVIAENVISRLEEALASIEVVLAPIRTGDVPTFAREFVTAQAKALEIQRFVFGDSDEERKRRGRPPGDEGSLPSLDSVLKPDEPGSDRSIDT